MSAFPRHGLTSDGGDPKGRAAAAVLLAACWLLAAGCATPGPPLQTRVLSREAPPPASTHVVHELDREALAALDTPGGPDGPDVDTEAEVGDSGLLPSEVVAPYSLERVIGTFGDCRPRGRQHRGIDLAGVGPDEGLGTPVVAMLDGEVILVGRPADDPHRYGRLDTRDGETERNGVMLPRSKEVPGYGRVFFFTRKPGSWRSGAIISTRVVGGPYDGYVVRYMHLGDVHPDLAEGDRLRAGQELGVMGGTAVQWSPPHVHIDVENREGRRVDVAPLLGLEPDNRKCRKSKKKRRRR